MNLYTEMTDTTGDHDISPVDILSLFEEPSVAYCIVRVCVCMHVSTKLLDV